MNKLAICNKVKILAGIPGAVLTTLATPSKEIARLISWVDDAWEEIQTYRPDWEWLRNSFSFNTVASQSTYSPSVIGLTDFGEWRNDSFRSFLTSAGVGTEIPLTHYEYNGFRDYYLLGARKITYARPIAISIAPDKSLVLGLAPNDVFTVSGEYYATPRTMATDMSIPEMPLRFHMLIVHQAMMKYGIYESASEVIAEHQGLFSKLMNRLEIDQAPIIYFGGSLI